MLIHTIKTKENEKEKANNILQYNQAQLAHEV